MDWKKTLVKSSSVPDLHSNHICLQIWSDLWTQQCGMAWTCAAYNVFQLMYLSCNFPDGNLWIQMVSDDNSGFGNTFFSRRKINSWIVMDIEFWKVLLIPFILKKSSGRSVWLHLTKNSHLLEINLQHSSMRWQHGFQEKKPWSVNMNIIEITGVRFWKAQSLIPMSKIRRKLSGSLIQEHFGRIHYVYYSIIFLPKFEIICDKRFLVERRSKLHIWIG